MSIKIKQYALKWRLEIEHEEFEFDSRKDMELSLTKILDIKEKKGQLKNRSVKNE
jgi:hypothetical protein